MAKSPFEITVYQIAPDETFKSRRNDGTGWTWSWAPWQRQWMDATQNKFAYRCLPLTIANQTGWWVHNPVAFTAFWNGKPSPSGIRIMFDCAEPTWGKWITGQFGHGILTWNTPFLFRTKPAGSRLLVCGPINYFKDGIQPLTAIIESDWMTMSFTMNWKFTSPNVTVRFEMGEPLFQVIPLGTNICRDMERAKVTYMRLADDPKTAEAYRNWDQTRRTFHVDKQAGRVDPGAWQRDYFQGRKSTPSRAAIKGHMTKVVAPKIKFKAPSI